MKRIKFATKQEHEYIQNWKLLQGALKKVGIEKVMQCHGIIARSVMAHTHAHIHTHFSQSTTMTTQACMSTLIKRYKVKSFARFVNFKV